jgi:hypothetical protein
MKNKGSIPIPYIIALLLGIAVVAILGYWFFVLGGQWGGEASIDTCRTRAHTYCVEWQTYGFVGTTEPDIVNWFGDKYPSCRTYEKDATIGFSGGSSDLNIPGDVTNDIGACQRILGYTNNI